MVDGFLLFHNWCFFDSGITVWTLRTDLGDICLLTISYLLFFQSQTALDIIVDPFLQAIHVVAVLTWSDHNLLAIREVLHANTAAVVEDEALAFAAAIVPVISRIIHALSSSHVKHVSLDSLHHFLNNPEMLFIHVKILILIVVLVLALIADIGSRNGVLHIHHTVLVLFVFAFLHATYNTQDCVTAAKADDG